MLFKLLTLNTLFNKAVPDLGSVLLKYRPDVICLQETRVDSNELNDLHLYGYELADFTHSFMKFNEIYGVATYYNAKKLALLKTKSVELPRTILEGILFIVRGGNNPRSVLRTEFRIKQNKKRIIVYNVHLTILGSNGARIRQLKDTLSSIESKIDSKTPSFVAGDFNYYPMRRKKLEELIKRFRFNEATRTIEHTFMRERYQDDFIHRFLLKIIPRTTKMKIDYILYRNADLKTTERIDYKLSDHYPIISSFSL